RHRMWLAVVALALFSVLYCLPWHPGAGKAPGWDVLLHVLVFAGLAWGGARWLGLGGRGGAGLLLLGVALEVAQWRVGGYARPEWRDAVANGAGVLAGWGMARLSRMGAAAGGDVGE
ncbi:MAG: hypothetical protein ACTHKZ_03605, partial [Lysobacteraceae bacterium]